LPSLIGRYRVQRELGRGAMGVIYQAEDPDIGRTVAIKLVRADLLDGDDREEFLARFRHEARAAGRCTHPNIVAIYDFAMHEGNPFLVMEYIDGVGLGQALKRVGRYAPAEAVAIAVQMLQALHAAHGLGVVHRDVKPANVLLLPSGQVKMTDFGISRLNTSEITQDGAVIGTPAYMSPEQCRGETVDARSDLFSVGTVLYELLTGTRAFTGRNVTEVTWRVLTAQPNDPVQIAADVPDALADVLRKAMAKDREQRHASAQEMADALAVALCEGGEDVSTATADRTIVMVPRPAATPEPRATVDDATLDTIERRLARHIGPIARHLVRDAARRANSIEELCETVSRNIAAPADRQRFLAESMDGSLSPGGMTSMRSSVRVPAATGAGFSPEQIERVERALTKALGPIAKVLVKRALPGVASEAALWEKLATHIQRVPDREAFLRQSPGG
jgi:tRNA A-37 threonylcarbamoyl transferase component Bud32